MQNQPVKQEDAAVIIWPRNYNTRWLQFTAKWRNLIAIWMSSDTATWRSMTAIWQIKDKLASCGCVMCVRAWGLACGLVRARMVVLVRATNTCVCLLVCDSQCVCKLCTPPCSRVGRTFWLPAQATCGASGSRPFARYVGHAFSSFWSTASCVTPTSPLPPPRLLLTA